MLNAVFNNLYTFLLGKFYTVRLLGYYTQANKIAETSNFTFSAIFGKTSYNIFAKIHDDGEKLISTMRKMIQKSSLIVMPCTIFLFFAAKPIFFTLFGEKWLASVPYFQLICIANLFTCVYQMNNNGLNSIGKSKESFKVELIKRIIILISVVLCFEFGVMALLIGYAISCFLAWFISILQVQKHIGLKIADQLKDIVPAMFWGIIVSYLGYLCGTSTENLYFRLIIQGTVSFTLYAGVICIFHQDVLDYILRFLKIKK
jgi:O-antigen/teichoic acid export membrane protein